MTRLELEPKGLAVVAVEISSINNKIFLFSWYRQWSVPGIPGSNSPEAQLARFQSFMDVIKRLASKSKVIVCSDSNIDLHDMTGFPPPHLCRMRDDMVTFHDHGP